MYPTKWVLTDKNEHLWQTPEYTPKWKARLVACGNFEHIGREEDIRADSPTAEPESLRELPSFVHGLFHSVLGSGQAISRTHASKGNPLRDSSFLRFRSTHRGPRPLGLKPSQVLSALYFITGEDNKLCAAICTHVDDFLWAATPSGEPIVQRLLDRFKIGRIESDTFRFAGASTSKVQRARSRSTVETTHVPFVPSTFTSRKRGQRL